MQSLFSVNLSVTKTSNFFLLICIKILGRLSAELVLLVTQHLLEKIHGIYIPGQIFHDCWASKPLYRQKLCYSKTTIHGFGGSKFEKCLVRSSNYSSIRECKHSILKILQKTEKWCLFIASYPTEKKKYYFLVSPTFFPLKIAPNKTFFTRKKLHINISLKFQ